MRGHIVKRYEGSYTIVLNLGRDPASGKRKQQWVSIKGGKKDAEKKLAELLHQIDTGYFQKPGKTTVAEFLKRWLAEYARPNLSPRTYEGYETIVRRHLIPKLGSVTLTGLKPEHIQTYYSETLKTGRCDNTGLSLTARTVRHHHMVLHRALEVAMKWGLVQRNPADATDPPKAQRSEIHIMNEDDIARFLEAAMRTRYYAMFYLDLFTGMRRSELLALRWSDVDLILCQVSVSRSLHQLRDGSLIYRQPKTARGRRTIALSPSTAIVLSHHRDNCLTECVLLGKQLQESYLVFSADGKPVLPSTVTQAWRRLALKTGLVGVRLHDARHTHASLLLKQGIHPAIVQTRLGHASVATTIDIYSHVMPGLQEAAAKKFDDGLAFALKNGVVDKVG